MKKIGDQNKGAISISAWHKIVYIFRNVKSYLIGGSCVVIKQQNVDGWIESNSIILQAHLELASIICGHSSAWCFEYVEFCSFSRRQVSSRSFTLLRYNLHSVFIELLIWKVTCCKVGLTTQTILGRYSCNNFSAYEKLYSNVIECEKLLARNLNIVLKKKLASWEKKNLFYCYLRFVTIFLNEKIRWKFKQFFQGQI